MNSRVVAIVGIALALWMSAGRWAFGIGGSLTLWYLPAIGLTFAALQIWLARRLRLTRERGFRTRRATIVSLWLSWACAVGFGFTVPDLAGGGLISILGLLSGSAFSTEMSIALCNPLGIIAFAMTVAAIGFSMADAREPRPEEDELDDAGEGSGMTPHPLA